MTAMDGQGTTTRDRALAGGLTEEDVAGSVAIVGMACRFPQADSLERFWANLERGVESISYFRREELEAAGVPQSLLDAPGFVPAKPILDDVDHFDAPFFEISPREAEILDPQHRLFLEVAWEALERSGYAVDDFPGWAGLFAGVSFPSYWVENLARRPDLVASVGPFQVFLANDRDYFATRVSYALDLKGPSVNVQSACSTSLVAVHLACQSLLDHQSDLALAGGARVQFPVVNGYVYQEGGIVSPDGHCRPFDASASGSIFGDGVGVVVLKRLADALADGDSIDAILRGSAMNNDGSAKVGYTAPSIQGQSEVVALALGLAGVDPDTVTYVETHGSGTPLGDPIEVEALTEVFRGSTERSGFCALGSVKSNFGHLEAAAGVAGLIKTVLALKHRRIPPSLHCRQPNPRIAWESSPFYVATELIDWEVPDGAPRRAGVSSFGIGGTNVHLVLEEAPEPPPPEPSRSHQLLVLSARTPSALEAATDRLADHLAAARDEELPDAAFTLLHGRRHFEHRRAVVCTSRREAVEALRTRDTARLQEGVAGGSAAAPVFLLAGLGDHYPGMGAGLYRDEPAFREAFDRAAELLRESLDEDPRDLLFAGALEEGEPASPEPDLLGLLGRRPAQTPEGARAGSLESIGRLHPTLFAVEYALARLWMSLGIEPAALLGYSLGEYVAACLAGVLSLEEALAVVVERARLVEELPEGAMLAVALGREETGELLAPPLAIAALNGPGLTVVAGPAEAVEELGARCAGEGVTTRRLASSHAFHSEALEPAAGPLTAALSRVELRPPEIPFLSNVTGTWITDQEATDPEYWARHLVSPVRFSDGLATLFARGHRTFVEIGPGSVLGSLVHQNWEVEGDDAGPVVVPSMRAAFERRPDQEQLLRSLGRLWTAGVVPGPGFWGDEARRRLPLPTYPFERRRYWIDPVAQQPGPAGAAPDGPREAEPDRPRVAAVHDRPRLGTPFVEPAEGIERELADIWREILGIDRVGGRDHFFELGGNSLIVPQVLLRVRQAVGVELPVVSLLQAPTLGAFAGVVEQARREGVDAVVSGEPVDLGSAGELDPEIRPDEGIPLELQPAPEAVFLTGGTGFFGAFLLDRLLRSTDARVYCLVRAEDRRAGAERLEEALRTYRLWSPELTRRVVPVPGDLAEPFLGLEPDGLEEIAGAVQAVYHAGAWVNFTYPYRVLAPVNVDGTREALRLAASVRPKPFHFVSSIAVFAPGSLGADGIAYEDSELPATDGLFSGYAETKWVAERLVRQASERGIPVTIHRPGVIGGSSTTGAGNPRDLVWNMLKGCIQLGVAPRAIGRADVAPADYVAAALVRATQQPASRAKAFHYPNPRTTPWDEIFEAADSAGYPLRLIPYPEWRQLLLDAVLEGRENALGAFVPLLPEPAGAPPGPAAERGTSLQGRQGDDDTNTREAIAGTGIECPPLDRALLRTYLQAFVEMGFLAKAPAAKGAGATGGAARKGA